MKYLKTHYSRMSRHRIFKLGTSRGIHSIDTWCVRSQNAGAGARVGVIGCPLKVEKFKKYLNELQEFPVCNFFDTLQPLCLSMTVPKFSYFHLEIRH